MFWEYRPCHFAVFCRPKAFLDVLQLAASDWSVRVPRAHRLVRPRVVGALSQRNYDVTRDGQRFLMVKEGAGAEDTSAPPSLTVVQNWHEELKRLVPTN